MREIGGYLELERLEGSEYHTNALRINCARNAIVLAASLSGLRKVLLPYYLCNSVGDALKRSGIECKYYHIDAHFLPERSVECGKGEMILAVNYFGQVDVQALADRFGDGAQLMIDNTQAFFCMPPDGVDAVCSCRKYFGVPDGAYLYARLPGGTPSMENERVAAHCAHLIGRLEDKASAHLEESRRNDRSFAQRPIAGMSLFTQNILRAVNYESVRKRRNENYQRLERALKGRNALELKRADAPFAYPLYVKNSGPLREKLARRRIYVPTLWPNVLRLPETWLERQYAADILPLPCDQRYTPEDMDALLEVLEGCIS